MEARIIVQGLNDEPQLADLRHPVIDLSDNPKITFCLIEGGMKSGEPSVLIVSEVLTGSIILQTSLDKFLMSASTMATAAENQWGWKRPEGHFTIMPPDKETRKKMLEAIKEQLEGWED